MYEDGRDASTPTAFESLSTADRGVILDFAINTHKVFIAPESKNYLKIQHIKVIRAAFPAIGLKAAKIFAEMSDVYWNNQF
jgi:ribosomal protein L7/L12